MAIGRQDKLAMTQHDISGYISDESEFYGDEATVQEMEYRAGTLDAADWWQHRTPSFTEIANSNMAAVTEKATTTLYNPYEGFISGRQLWETVDEFLQRLPPATTRVSETIPWIHIANPFRKVPTRKSEQNSGEIVAEGPPSDDSDWAQFVVLAGNLLRELTAIRHAIEKQNAGGTKDAVTRAFTIEKDKTVRKILDTATELHCTSGKWMIFCPPGEVNTVWSVVARHTAEADFGIASKVAPNNGACRDRLICIYTKDFNDMEDVTRVICKMKELGLVSSRERPVYYKCDAYTYLGLNSNNEYNIRASMYNSADILAGKTEKKHQQKLDGLLNTRREYSSWRQSGQ